MYFFTDERENALPVRCRHVHSKVKGWTIKVKQLGVGLYHTRRNLTTIRYTTLIVLAD